MLNNESLKKLNQTYQNLKMSQMKAKNATNADLSLPKEIVKKNDTPVEITNNTVTSPIKKLNQTYQMLKMSQNEKKLTDITNAKTNKTVETNDNIFAANNEKGMNDCIVAASNNDIVMSPKKKYKYVDKRNAINNLEGTPRKKVNTTPVVKEKQIISGIIIRLFILKKITYLILI